MFSQNYQDESVISFYIYIYIYIERERERERWINERNQDTLIKISPIYIILKFKLINKSNNVTGNISKFIPLDGYVFLE